MKRQEVEAIMLLAGIEIKGIHSIVNQYWPGHQNYDDMRERFPWWVVDTADGKITIGWRKRVIAIDWSFTNRRGEITKDDVTKSNSMVHAWATAKAVEYLRQWKELPAVDVTLPGIKDYLCSDKADIMQHLNLLFEDTPERAMFINLIETAPEGMNVIMSFTAANGYYNVHARIGTMSVALLPRPEPKKAE